jgi:hypothetical protein
MLNIQLNQTEIINTIKLLIYKENPSLLEKIDFDDDEIFLEPLLFFYFNHKIEDSLPNELLTEFMQGYFLDNPTVKIKHSYNDSGIAYLPVLGYFKNGEPDFLETIHRIDNTNIEVFKHSVDLINAIYKDTSGKLIPIADIVSNIDLFEKNITYLTNAISIIKETSKEHFQLIEKCCKKIVLFKTDPDNTNSFATIKIHGVAFLNVYQDDYDEVFFIDDIAHQSGHVILTTLLYNRKAIFKIDEEQNVEDLLKSKDHRTVYILLHALYTYYTTLLCLDNALSGGKFTKQQQKEAIARIGFYLHKCDYDLKRFDKIGDLYSGLENVLTIEGQEIYNLIKEKYSEVSKKWQPTIKNFNYTNQTYNFTFKNFADLNTLEITQL